MPRAYYVIASRANGAYRLPLVGPFRSMTAAIKMWDVTHDAVRRIRPDLADCNIRPDIVQVQGKLPAGRLDLDQAVDAAWIKGCIYGNRD